MLPRCAIFELVAVRPSFHLKVTDKDNVILVSTIERTGIPFNGYVKT
jgi:hypothetical protein